MAPFFGAAPPPKNTKRSQRRNRQGNASLLDEESDGDSYSIDISASLADEGEVFYNGPSLTGASQPLQIFNETANEIVSKAINVTGGKNGTNSESAKAMHVRLNSKGDTLAVMTAVMFSAIGCVICMGTFILFRQKYPDLYANYGFENRTVYELEASDVIEAAGLDAWMFLSLHGLAMRLIGSLILVAICLCPLHWLASDPSREWLTRLSLSATNPNSIVLWAHTAATWYVVTVAAGLLAREEREFVALRRKWLVEMPAPRATTILVRGVPEPFRTDQALEGYFVGLFSRHAVVRGYIVRRTRNLEVKQRRLEAAQERSAHARGARSGLRQSVSMAELEVGTERARLARAAETYDPDVCSSTGLITFAMRSDARRAAIEQFADDPDVLYAEQAPAPSDLIYENVAEEASEWKLLVGWLWIAALFTVWIPLVLFVSGILSLSSLETMFPALQTVRASPWVNAFIDGILATLVLNGLMGSLPFVFLWIMQRFFEMRSHTDKQQFLHSLYYIFQLIFVLLVTAFGQGLISTLVFLAEYPTGVIPLLARTLPMASHFYLSYIVLGWCTTTLDLIRIPVLLKYLGFLAFMSDEEARASAEADMCHTGERHGKAAMMLVIVLVFCSLSPLILLFALVYFSLGRVVYTYLIVFAEPPRCDTGGAFWVRAVDQVRIGLVVYDLLMLGVLLLNGIGPFLFALPTLPLLIVGWYRSKRSLQWERMSMEAAIEADSLAANDKIKDGPATEYSQPDGFAGAPATTYIRGAAEAIRIAAGPEQTGED